MSDTIAPLPPKIYNTIKYLVLIALPALSAAYFTLAGTLNLPYATQVVGTLAVLCTLLGTLTGVSSKIYNNSERRFDGNVDVLETDTSLIHQFEFTIPPEQLKDQDSVLFKVRKIPENGGLEAPQVPE